MGWTSEDPRHEGYLIGFVERDGVTPGAGADGLLRECCYPGDDQARRLLAISAGCDCGWRSPRWVPRETAEWFPHMVEAAADEEGRGRAAWHRHLVQEGVEQGARTAGAAPQFALCERCGISVPAHRRLCFLCEQVGPVLDEKQPTRTKLPDGHVNAVLRLVPAPSAPVIPMATSPFSRTGSRLHLRREDSGPRHHLEGKPVQAGTVLELSLAPDSISCAFADPDPAWLRGRYEWSFETDDPPLFYVGLGDGRRAPPREGEDASVGAAALPLPPAAILRWPSED